MTLVAHSMGGIVASKYIEMSSANKNKVEKLITLGTPYLGAPKILYMMEVGKLFAGGFNISERIKNSILAPALKQILPNIETAYQLMPFPAYFNYNNTYYVQKFIDVPWYSWGNSDKKIDLKTYDETKTLFSERSWAKNSAGQVKAFLNNAESFQNSLTENYSNVINSVESYVIAGYGYDTIAKVREKYDENGNYVSLDDTDVINGGDGTVPVISANIGGKSNPDRTYYVKEEHTGLVSNDSVINLVINIINGRPNDFDSKISKQLPQPGWFGIGKIKLKVECPVNLSVFDQNDNLVGSVSDKDIENELNDGSSFYHLGENNEIKIAYLNEGNYNVKLNGTGSGVMKYTVQKIDTLGNVVQTIRFDNVNITASTIISTDTDMNKSIKLNVDEDGDGIIDKTISPLVVLDQFGSNDETAPTIKCSLDGVNGNNGWFKSDVNVKLEAEDDLSGVNRIEYILSNAEINKYSGALICNNEGINTISAAAFDNNSNYSTPIKEEFKIDKNGPDIISNIKDGTQFKLNQAASISFSATDTISGVDNIQSSIANGQTIDTSTAGDKCVTIIATDLAGNVTTKTIHYSVRYVFGGLLQPINDNGSSVFKAGSTIPVKFKLYDGKGNIVRNATAKLFYQKNTNNINCTTLEAEASGNSNTANIFRFDTTEGQYIYSMTTKNMTSGTLKLIIILDDGSETSNIISLK